LLTVPASVNVASGTAAANFSATAGPAIASDQTATVMVTLGTSSQTAPIALQAPVMVSNVSCVPASLKQSDKSTCTVKLNKKASTGGNSITLATDNSLLAVPASVIVASGKT